MNILTKKVVKCLILSLFISFFSNCGIPEVKKEAPGINEIKKDSKFRIILPEDHRTGYLWQLSPGFDQKTVENYNVVWHGNGKGVYFEFIALNPGQVTLTLVNRKYTDTANVKSFIIKIIE